jgi:macrocin-O-methyltransferase TylF-like protien
MSKSGYPSDHIVYVKGMVENTIPKIAPQHIALLRLDTDLYASTIHELGASVSPARSWRGAHNRRLWVFSGSARCYR